MKHNTKDKKKLINDCARKMRAAELQSEQDSIIKLDYYKKVEKHKYRDIQMLRSDHMEVDYEVEKEFLSGHAKALKNDLLDIEVKLTDALTIAFKDFESRLKNLINGMRERTSVFFEETIEEVVQFTQKLKYACLEKAEEVTAYLDAVPDEKKE
jgi:hypothetical protein